ncbi:hypothetical protein N7526_009367 [Penicillium atrosanguineum]|nr:hypothetical protein N7526_009367 [Penicillium atrosanguineum]
MESPALHPESPMEQEDIPYPCMGCGEILEEGKAFELYSDAHLLLLGDGSLICSSCTYSCNSCGNKIEDLAILTGDQAFCAQCFRCRNCKRKIENLRYARTSQGIFCMDCHESLMQRRRKKKATAAARKPGAKLDKSLPSLPPSMEETQSIDESPSEVYVEAADIQIAGPDSSADRASFPTRESATDICAGCRIQTWKTESDRSSRSDLPLAMRETSAFSGATSPESSRSKDTANDTTRSMPLESVTSVPSRPSNDLRRLHEHDSVDSSRSQQSAYPPRRGDSLEKGPRPIPRKEVGSSPNSSAYGSPTLPNIGFEQPKQLTSLDTRDGADSPSIPQYKGGSEFSADEDLARLMSEDGTSDSFMRRMSSSIRHGRSHSEKSIRTGREGKNPRSPASITGTEIASPTTSISQAEEIAWLRAELRKERQRSAEMEGTIRATVDVKKVNTELSEKRSTMVVLDAQREIVLRELTVLTDHLEAEKRGAAGGPLDLGKLSNHVLRELAEAIHKLKESYAPQIEELIQQRNELHEELATMTRQKEKTFQEFEQLSSKNAQLAELNNQLVHQIQELYKVNSDGQRGSNGLGIVQNKEKSMASVETMKPAAHDFPPSISHAHIADDVETTTATATIVPGPHVVSIRKGQPRKFNWKKGGEAEAAGGLPRSQTQDPSRQGFGFFGNQRNKQGGKMSQADSVPALAEAASGGLFGTDLEARMEHEKSIIPAIVTRCIQEVELRGMDMEGIYRKSGAASAIQGIRDGFERNPFDYDISDPDLDIHAVTSALKQYFRKLPMPLITYDVYETIIDSAEVSSVPGRVELLQRNLRRVATRVVERQEENLMTSQNVAVVFAPTIMRPESLAREMTDVQKKNDILKFLVDNCQDIFMGMQG